MLLASSLINPRRLLYLLRGSLLLLLLWMFWLEGASAAVCVWHANTTSVECSTSSSDRQSGSVSSGITNEDLFQEAKNLKLICDPSARGLKSLRDILDTTLEQYESTPWQEGLDSLEVVDCPLDILERLDLLYIDSSVTTHLSSLKITSSQPATKEFVIQARAFDDGPRTLKSLDLSSNGLASLYSPEDALFSLCPLGKSLQKLNLSSNQILELSDLGLWNHSKSSRCHMEAMTNLILSNNSLERVPRAAFVLANNLEDLDLSQNSINTLDPGALTRLGSLKVLSLAHNQLSVIPKDLLDPKNALRELYLNNNSLAHLPESLFERLTSLVVLNLSQNALVSSEHSPFKALKSLVALDLSHNRLESVSGDFFVGLSSLQVLTVAHNRLLSVEASAFASVPLLHALVLSHNELEGGLAPKLFDGLHRLSSLAIDHNRIKGLNR